MNDMDLGTLIAAGRCGMELIQLIMWFVSVDSTSRT